MLKKTIAAISLPILLILMVCFSSCGKQDEPAQEPEVKSFKIEKPIRPADTPPPAVPGPGATPVTPISPPGPGGAVAPPGSPPPLPGGPSAPGSSLPVPSATGLAPAPAVINTPAFALGGDVKTELVSTYNPTGRIDPFEPLFQTKAGKGANSGIRQQTFRDTRKGKLTPLENLDISQMKLTAIIVGPDRSIAMVQESTGKGHVIKKGTFIGINSGRVVDIRPNEVIIEEEVEDLLGKIIVRKRELKLQKPLGEM